ncbi:MAG: putative nucleic acid-binding protein [Candidatus Nitrosomirales archaeon]|jgi:predicted nucleic acid-binding protein
MKVLDSDLIISSLRGRSDAMEKVKHLEQTDTLVLTSLTEYEVMLGTYFSREDIIVKTEDFLSRYTVLPLDAESAKRAAKIRAELMKQGSDLADIDVLIAAIALEYDATLVTRNKAHFARIDKLSVEEW